MNNLDQILNALHMQADDPRLTALTRFLQTKQGQSLAQSVTPQTASRISQAAQAAGRGDQEAAKQAMQEILRSPEGAALAARLRSMLGQ